MDRLTDFRRVYAQMVVSRAGCPHDHKLMNAFAKVQRHLFVGAGPWLISEDGLTSPSDDPALAYHDMAIGLVPGIPTGSPSLHATLIHACDIANGSSIVHVGVGAGYYTAILAELVGRSGSVTGFEVIDELATRARSNLADWPWVDVRAESGVRDLADGVDLVYVSAGVQQLPLPWLAALAPAGQLVFPLVPGTDQGGVLLVRSTERQGVYAARFLCPARFVPCVGAADEAASGRLSAAFREATMESVHSLRLGTPPPGGEAAWFEGAGWWLSTAEPDA